MNFLEEIKLSKEIILEVRFGEGGDDSKLFVKTLFDAYIRYAKSNGLQVEEPLLEDYGHMVTRIKGNGAGALFWEENGQHVIQRVPPTEHNGRTQTSYVIVTVLPVRQLQKVKVLPEIELEEKFQTGRQKAGGQNVNKVASAVRLRHRPTGMSVFINGRDQVKNREIARKILAAKVDDFLLEKTNEAFRQFKMQYIGSGRRGNKVRTYNEIESRCVDHRSGKKTKDFKGVILKGKFNLLKKG